MTDARVSFVARAQSFHDVDALLMNYFTFRALKETLSQMQETDLCVRELAGDGARSFSRASPRASRRGCILDTRARASEDIRVTDDDGFSSYTLYSRRSPGKGEYKWLYNFAAAEYQNRGDEFIKKLFAEGRSDHAQRILAQRVVLMRRWRSYFNRGLGGEKCSEKFEDKNLELLREQLFCALNASPEECDEPEESRRFAHAPSSPCLSGAATVIAALICSRAARGSPCSSSVARAASGQPSACRVSARECW